jgi:hypothetical protein
METYYAKYRAKKKRKENLFHIQTIGYLLLFSKRVTPCLKVTTRV